MNWSRYSLALIILLLLVGCSQWDANTSETPTPFTSVEAEVRAPVGEPIAISLTHLAANPELFEGSNLQLIGQYQLLPKLICERGAHPSPATWAIVGEGLLANATGHDQQLRQLLKEGQEVTVDGRWLHYAGPVGCGKSAPVQEIWYLSVNRIVDPHPLARVMSDSAGIDTEPSTIVELPLTPTLTVTATVSSPVETATLEPTMTLVALPTYVASPTPLSAAATAVFNATPSLTPSSVTVTPSGTGTAVTPTITGTITTTPTITSTPIDGSATPGRGTATPADFKGELDFEELMMSTLESGTVDSWTITIDSSDFLTVTVAPGSSANMLLSVLDENGQFLVDRQNLAAAGAVETITNLSLTEPGTYQIHVAANPAEKTDYALMVTDSNSYDFRFRGTLSSDAQRTDSLSVNSDHFWFFSASDGETVNIEVTPIQDKDAYVELYGTDGSRLLTLDDGENGIAEILDNHSILATGMYAIRIGEFDFAAMSYRIILNKS